MEEEDPLASTEKKLEEPPLATTEKKLDDDVPLEESDQPRQTFLKKRIKYDPLKAAKEGRKKRAASKSPVKESKSINASQVMEVKKEESPVKEEENPPAKQGNFLKKKKVQVNKKQPNLKVKSRVNCWNNDKKEEEEEEEEQGSVVHPAKQMHQMNHNPDMSARFQVFKQQIGVEQLEKAYHTNYMQKYNGTVKHYMFPP